MPSPDDYRAAAQYRRSTAADVTPALDPALVVDAIPASPAAPAPKGGGDMATRPYDAFAMGAEWLDYIARNMDKILQREGSGQDLKLYEALLDDDNAFAMLMQRRDALIARPWIVEPGDKDDPRSVEAADDLRRMLEQVGFDHFTRLAFLGVWFGYSIAEGIYTIRSENGRAKVWLDKLIVPDRNWFAFSNGGELRMRAMDGQDGVEGKRLPDNKFCAFRFGQSHDFSYYGTGLAHWCYWPIFFKRNGMQFWALYLEKYGQPTAVGYFEPGSDDQTVAKLLAALTAIGRDSAVALPKPPSDPNGKTDYAPKLLEAQRGGGSDSYDKFAQRQDEAVTRVIVGQTMTSRAASAGLGSNQASIQGDRLMELVKADSDEMHAAFNKTFPVWLTRWNYGPDVAPPTVYRQMDDEEDLGTIAERDSKLDSLGWRRTDDSFRQVYGDGYERKEEVAPPVPQQPEMPPQRQPIAFAATDAKPLYVKRDLVNVAEFRRWAVSQGFADVQDDLHVTVLYSRQPVNWLEMGQAWGNEPGGKLTVEPGGVRIVDYLGDKGAIVLHFVCDALKWRHCEMIERGASDDHGEYQAHVTITYDPARSIDLSNVEPYRGKLVFGPEYFEELDPPSVEMPSLAFSAEQLDRITALSNAMTAESEPIILAFGEAIRDKLATFSDNLTPDELRIALLEAAERFPADQIGAALGKVLTTVHAGAAANLEGDVQP